MKKKYLILLFILAASFFYLNSLDSNKRSKKNLIAEIKQRHKNNLEKSPFKDQLKLSKKERKAKGLPPNKYFEEQWELEMNPILGRPTPEKINKLRAVQQEKHKELLLNGRVPGDALDNPWVERGPNNVGGRTRAVLFDPNDATNNTVFAGGVSGGLWKNTNIADANSTWVRVGIPENLAISCITYDPLHTNIFYVGTGESYVGGAVNGDGVWKSVDSGTTWTKVFGGISGDSYFQSASNITVHSPAGIAGNYLSFPTTAFGPEITSVITANIVLADDGTSAPTEGCNTFTNTAAMNGKIALIRRANCNFTVKVKNAQLAGAVGVIMMNNIDGEPIPMGGSDPSITIPSVMISKADGDLIEAAVNSGTVNGSLNPASGDFTGILVPGIQHINDIKVRANGSVSEVYVAAGDSFYGSSNATTYLGGPEYGLYKSTDAGVNWTEVTLPATTAGNKYCPNDIEIASDNKIWLSTIKSTLFNDGGGKVFSSTDGVNFVEKWSITNGDRTQIAVSSTAPDKVYVLAEVTTPNAAGTGTQAPYVVINKTTSGFVPSFGVQTMPLPNDADSGITSSDFTRGQAFYDLMLEVDPINDETVYVGGIDLFKSTNGATSWNQFSHWFGGYGYQDVHSDQHGLAFGNNDASKLLFGNDGGVFYSSNAGTTTTARNKGFNVTQFYSLGVAPTANYTGDYFIAGAQDNGSQLFENSNAGTDASTEASGGDGAYSFFDQDGTDKYYITNYVYNQTVLLNNYAGANVTINNEGGTNGSFINPQALDSNLDILYSNYSASGNYIIKRYKGIKSSGTLTKINLTDALLTTTPTAFTVSPYTTTSSKLLVGTVLGDLLLVNNADTTPIWSEISGPSFVGSVSDVEYGASENDIFVTMHNYGVVNVWYTNDGGTTWMNKEGNLPDLPVKAILQNPLNTEQVIIGTELGIWFTNDFSSASPTWEQGFNGMSNVKVTDLDLRDDNKVFAATFGRGVFSGDFTAASGLSVEEQNIKVFSVYPNPSNGNISIKPLQNLGDVKATIFDINGRKVFSKKLQLDNETQMDASSLNAGIYILKIQGDNFSHSEKLIIQ